MTNHHLLLACFLPAKRISRKHDRSPEGMVIWSIGSLGFNLCEFWTFAKLLN